MLRAGDGNSLPFLFLANLRVYTARRTRTADTHTRRLTLPRKEDGPRGSRARESVIRGSFEAGLLGMKTAARGGCARDHGGRRAFCRNVQTVVRFTSSHQSRRTQRAAVAVHQGAINHFNNHSDSPSLIFWYYFHKQEAQGVWFFSPNVLVRLVTCWSQLTSGPGGAFRPNVVACKC